MRWWKPYRLYSQKVYRHHLDVRMRPRRMGYEKTCSHDENGHNETKGNGYDEGRYMTQEEMRYHIKSMKRIRAMKA